MAKWEVWFDVRKKDGSSTLPRKLVEAESKEIAIQKAILEVNSGNPSLREGAEFHIKSIKIK